jgi:hypothetical protein
MEGLQTTAIEPICDANKPPTPQQQLAAGKNPGGNARVTSLQHAAKLR